MGAGCCKVADDLNPDNSPKDPQTKEQRKEDGKELRRLALSADWSQMRVLLRRMPVWQICSGAGKDEAGDDDRGNTALHYSVSINHLRGIRKLLRYGTPPHVANKAGKTPLHLALETGKLKAARLLMEKSVALQSSSSAGGGRPAPCLINMKDGKGVSPLLAVVAAGRLKLAREVLALCKDLDVRIDFGAIDKEGNSPISLAAKWGWFDEVEGWLRDIQMPAKLLNVQNKQGETVLGHVLMFRASGLLDKQRALELATKLVDLGALVKLPAFQERVPLINLAAAADDKELYSLMVAKGAVPLGARDALGRSPLHFAAAKGARLVAQELLDAGLKAYALDSQHNTPLHLAAMRGQEATVKLLLERADDKNKALLTPNKSGLTAYHLALKAGPDERSQNNSLALIGELGGTHFKKPVIGPNSKVVDTPLLLAIQGHQDKVVRALLQKGCDANERNAVGELPLARLLRCATAETYEFDSRIFDMLMDAGADMSAASSTAHPLLALCKNNLSNFAHRVVGVLETRKGSKLDKADWDRRDEKGYTPLALAAFYDNAWLVRYLIDDVGIDPNDEQQRSKSTEPEVVGTTGGMCSAKPIQVPGTVAGQTPLMCAAKGASVGAVQLLLNRGADVHAVDAEGRTALQHALHLDKNTSLLVAAALLRKGANPNWGAKRAAGVAQEGSDGGPKTSPNWLPCTDLVGENWPHRAVRYGVSAFLRLWVECGGPLDSLLATTADDADDMPGAELKVEEKSDFLDLVPSRVDNELDGEDEELVDEYNGEDSEETPAAEDNEAADGNSSGGGAKPVAEGVELVDETAASGVRARRRASGAGSSSEDDCGEDDQQEEELAKLLDSGQAATFYSGPTPHMLKKWRRRGIRWWDDFWVNRDALPDLDLEDDPNWEDKYNMCEEGDEWIDEEDVEEEIWERVRAEQRAAARAVRKGQQARAQLTASAGGGVGESTAGQEDAQDASAVPSEEAPAATEALVARASSGLAHKLFRRRLPSAAIPATADETVNNYCSPSSASNNDDGKLASGSPTNWLRRNFSSRGTSTTPAASSRTPRSSFRRSTTGGSSSSIIAVEGDQSAAAAAVTSRQLSERGPGPVAEAQEDLAVLDVEDSTSPGKPLLQGYPVGSSSARQKSSSSSFRKVGDDEEEKTVLLLSPGGTAQLRSDASMKTTSSATTSRAASMKRPVKGSSASAAESSGLVKMPSMANMAAIDKAWSTNMGKLTAGASSERMFANEEYYQPDSMYEGLPRYMKVPTEPHPTDKYNKYVADLEARVQSYKINDDKRLEGADLRARNIAWYHKSMSPAEYPLKLGKWKSFQRMSAKAIEQARQRKPLKPGEKQQIRQKKVWFGLPPMPSRPELALTSPLVYAVRLGRVKCVEELLKYGVNLPDIPDAHGVTPLSYALYMLVKEPHNKSLQQIVDLLLAARPVVDSRVLWRTYLRPRMDSQLEALERKVAEKGGEGALSKDDKQTLKDLKKMVSFLRQEERQQGALPDYARLFPSLMDPLILTALLNDVGRTTYLVRELGAGLNSAWVWLTDIPTYFKGLLEKQVGRCNSRCSPLHVAICLKKFETVRALLDLGADPNLSGQEYTGDIVRDKEKRAKMDAEILSTMQAQREASAGFKPYAKLWGQVSSSLMQMLHSVKRFVSSIEIPGLTRPHPWVSPLHLACRFGLADITFLLLKRGAAANGADAAKFAPKSPLEEALAYARANAQTYGTTSERLNYHYILEESCVVESDRMNELTSAALAAQDGLHAALLPKATELLKSMISSKSAPKDALAVVRGLCAGSIVKFDPDSLRYVPIPPMNAEALASKANKMMSDAMAMFDPVKGSIKAVAIAAKIIIRVLLDMMKRPIAHCDPALACAHVMLYCRAPIDVAEKQTGILVRDILDNGNGRAGDEKLRLSYYRWLDIDPQAVNDDVWFQSVVNRITTLKSNVDYGYMIMDTATDFKKYEKAKKKFMSEVESSILNLGTNSLLPQYYLRTLIEIMPPPPNNAAGGNGSGRLLKPTAETARAAIENLFDKYMDIMTSKASADQQKPEARRAARDEAARGLLPAWVFSAPAGATTEGASSPQSPIALCETSGCDDVKEIIIARFVTFITTGGKVQEFKAPPVTMDLGERLKEATNNKVSLPAVPEEAVQEAQPTQEDLPDSDIVKAVVRMASAFLANRVAEQKKTLQALHGERAKHAAARRGLDRKEKMTRAAVGRQCAETPQARALVRDQKFPEDPIFASAGAANSNPANGEDGSGSGGGNNNRARASGTDDPGVYVDASAQKVSQLAEAAQTDGLEGAVALVMQRAAPRVASLTRVLQQLEDTGVLEQGADPQALVSDLIQEIGQRGPAGVADIWERKIGKALPEEVRWGVEKSVQEIASQIQQMRDNNELSPTAFVETGVAAIGSMSGQVLDAVDAQWERAASGISKAVQGDFSGLLELGDGLAPLLTKKLGSSGPVGQAVASTITELAQPDGDLQLSEVLSNGQAVLDAMGLVLAEAGDALAANLTAMEGALMRLDFGPLKAMGDNRVTDAAKAGAAAAARAALGDAIDRFKAALAAARDAAAATATAVDGCGAAADGFLDTLAQGVQEDLDKAAKAIEALADGFAALANGDGLGALETAFGIELTELVSAKVDSAMGALQGLDVEQLADDAAGALSSKMLGGMRNTRMKQLLTRYSLDDVPEELKSEMATQAQAIQQFISDFMDGIELDLGVDMASLMDALDDAREALLYILELLNMDESV